MNTFERNYNAKAIKNIRKILQSGRSSPLEEGVESSWHKVLRYVLMTLIVGCILFLLRGCLSDPAWSAEIPEKYAIKTIVGEASNQGLIGMTAVAEVIRHKGSLKGFYGLHASHSAHEPKWVWNMAKEAWLRSKYTHYTHEAEHFENIHAFGQPYWVKSCVKTFTYKDHVFYREII